MWFKNKNKVRTCYSTPHKHNQAFKKSQLTTPLRYFWWNPRDFWPSIDSNTTDTFKAHTKSDTIQKRCILKWRAETAECLQCRKNSHTHAHTHTHTCTHTTIDIHYNINNVSAGKLISFWLFWPNTVKFEWWGKDQWFDIIFLCSFFFLF